MNTNLSAFKHLSFALTYRMLWELHQGNRDAAWTNLLAVTRLNTAWETEPVEVSRMARMANMTTAEMATWQALQYRSWTDQQLASLQHEWESLNLFQELDQTAAVAGANAVMMCRLAREPSSKSAAFRMSALDVIRSPRDGWRKIVSDYREMAWRNGGSYDYEDALMLYFKAREDELTRAISAKSWSEMRGLPGVTNPPPLPDESSLDGTPLFKAEHLYGEEPYEHLAWQDGCVRIKAPPIIYCDSVGKIPATGRFLPPFAQRTPAAIPCDRTERFYGRETIKIQRRERSLYSVGLDCVDQGGDMTREKHWHESSNGVTGYSRGPENDLVWPRLPLPGETEPD